MKYVVLVGDGMADRPLKELNDRTPLEGAKIPHITEIAKAGQVCYGYTIPKGFTPASDVANLSVLGYDPTVYYKGRGPLEAANMNIELEEDDVAFRCNLVTAGEAKLLDYSAGHITDKEASRLMEALDQKLGSKEIKFYPGVSYRHLMVIKKGTGSGGNFTAICFPPHDVIGQPIAKNLPRGEGADVLKRLMQDSFSLLSSHEINKVRVDLKENPANMIWLWGQGTSPDMPMFADKYGLNGAVISAVNLVNGIGKLIGFEVISVPGATGYYDTNYQGKGDYAVEALKKHDFVFVHVEAPDEASHNGDIRAKIMAIENFDRHVVGTVFKYLKTLDEWRIMVLPDHATPISVRSHATDTIPLAICGTGVPADDIMVFSEKAARTSQVCFDKGHAIMDYFIKLEK
jgi:2,3-bisphosphoglycerate-independent phosphoglycerate mutase